MKPKTRLFVIASFLLYCSTGAIAQITWDTVGITVAGGNGQGLNSNQLNLPNGIFVDSKGNIFIADAGNNRVQKWAPGAKIGITVAGDSIQGGSAANELNDPTNIVVDSFGNLFITDQSNNRIQKWMPGVDSGITVAGGNGPGNKANQLHWPADVFLDGSNNIFICDGAPNNRIQKWATGADSGITVAGGNGNGSKANQLSGPTSVYVDKTGNIFIDDAGNFRIQKWAPGTDSGKTIAGGKNFTGYSPNQLAFTNGVYVDSIGNIFIADAGWGRVLEWTPGADSGITIVGGNGWGSNAEQFGYLTYFFLDKNYNLYVSDNWNNRVQEFKAITKTTTGISPINANSYFDIYPNPTLGVFNLRFKNQNFANDKINITIFDAEGKMLAPMSIGASNEIDMSGKPKGLYFVRVIAGGNEYVAKVAVQ